MGGDKTTRESCAAVESCWSAVGSEIGPYAAGTPKHACTEPTDPVGAHQGVAPRPEWRLMEGGTDIAAVKASAILTPDQRVRVFVSSTMEELAAERAAVRDAVERLHLSPILFELGARAHPPHSLYRSYLEQ